MQLTTCIYSNYNIIIFATACNRPTGLIRPVYSLHCVCARARVCVRGGEQLKYKFVGENAKNPGEAICRLATDEQADLIVIGTRGLGAIKRAVLGSVSEFVVRHSSLPCVVVQQKQLSSD